MSTHSSVKKYECTVCAQTFTRMEHMLNPKSYEHEANPQTNVKFVEKSVANDRKHTEEMHEEFRKSCTICEEAFTISSMNNHIWRVHETQINTCETCQYQYGRVHPNFPVGETKTESFKKKSKKKAVDESKDEATENDSAYQSDGTDKLEEANDDKFHDNDAANQTEAAPKSQTESKPKNKLIPESKPQPKAGEIENSPASFGSYTCATCDIEFPYKNPLNSHRLNMHASFPCEKCNRQVRCKSSFDEHMIGHKKPRK